MTVLYNDLGRLNGLKTGTYQNPVATVTATGRQIVNVSSVDTTNYIFTSTGSNLTNGWVIHATLNDNAGLVYLPNVIAGGVSAGTKYYVVNATANTFQIATTNGGSPITLSTNANMDLTKWHFESASTEQTTLQVTGLKPKKKYRVLFKGKTLRQDVTYIQPSTWGNQGDASWLRASGNGAVSYSSSYVATNGGNVELFIELLFESNSAYAVIRQQGIHVKTNNTTANTVVPINDTLSSPLYGNTNITDITMVIGGGLANGSVLEVYEA